MDRAAKLARAQARADNSDNRLITQGIKFIISGGISAIPDLGITFILQTFFGVGPVLARTAGFIVGTLTAYFINRRWTFQAEPSKRRFAAVALLYGITWGVNVGLHQLGFHLFTGWGLSDGLAIVCAYVIAQGVATVVNFVVQRTIIFKVR
ncbi:GtrA family protein [Corynebacterium sp. A21]|uniref:GtrA family protein n=1 Tax=Corynebacterium sp. A21 TaxID=3457318 RepID=UPI003FCF85F4